MVYLLSELLVYSTKQTVLLITVLSAMKPYCCNVAAHTAVYKAVSSTVL